jgi:putative cell wall-binding protein
MLFCVRPQGLRERRNNQPTYADTGDFFMKLVRPGIVVTGLALAVAVPLGAGAAASSSGVHPTVTLTGVVAGPTGVPLAGACVQLQTDPVPNATTDAGGHYTFTGVQPSGTGTLVISVLPACSTDPLGADYLPYTSGAIAVSAGTVTTADVTLQLGGSISGRVLASNETTGLYGACILAVPTTGPGGEQGSSAINGSYLLSELPVGSYALTFSDCNNTLHVQSRYFDNAQTLATSRDVVVTAGQTTQLDSQLLPAAGAVSLKVTDLQGNLIPGLSVEAFPEDPERLSLGSRSSSTTDSNGFYNFTDLLTTPYEFDYRYCAPGGGCRVGPIGYYEDRGPGLSPTLVEPLPGTTTTLHDAIAIPTLFTSTTTVAPSATPIVVGQSLQLNAQLSDGSGNPYPSGLVYFEENGQVLGSSGISQFGLGSVPATLSVGTHLITAVYNGDGESTPSQGHTTVVVTSAPSGGGSGGAGSGGTGSSGSSSSSGGGGGGATAPVGTAASVTRLAGTDRIATAVTVSQSSFPAGNAGAVVLARADDYPDALVGGPLAAARNAPLLLTEDATLPAATATEIKRVLPAGGTVYVLGGTSAVPTSVANQLTSFGYQVVRYSGADRYATAVVVATALGSPTTVLLATGTNFPDALAAGPAAAHVHGAILLTDGSTVPAETATYLAGAQVKYAIGGPAAAAVPSATAILGSDRYATAAAVATKFFPSSAVVGVATGTGFPDALAGGAQVALMGGPLLLSSAASVPASTSSYLTADHSALTKIYVYGGTSVLDANVAAELTAAFGG